jgi:excisionase family DNA binding protein
MPAIATAKPQKRALELLDAEPKGLLPIEVRSLSRYGLLELMRIGAGLSYKELGHRVGMAPAKARRLIRGGYKIPVRRHLDRIREALWEALPTADGAGPLRVLEGSKGKSAGRIHGRPIFLTLEEAATLLKVTRARMRRLASEDPGLGAIKIGVGIRIPLAAIEDYILAPIGADSKSQGLSLPETVALFRVTETVIGYLLRTGRIKAKPHNPHFPWRISFAEINRLMRFGTAPLPRLRDWRPRQRAKK